MTSKRKSCQEKLADKPGYPKALALETGFLRHHCWQRMSMNIKSLLFTGRTWLEKTMR